MKNFSRFFYTRAAHAWAFALLAAACVTLGGCTGGCSKDESEEKISSESAAENPLAKPYGRMKDSDYTNQLSRLMVEQKSERGKMLKLKAELDELQKLDPNSKRIAELDAALKESAKRMQLHQVKAQMVIRDRINREQADIRAAAAARNAKNGAKKSANDNAKKGN